MNKDKALAYLEQNRLLHMDIIDPILRDSAEILYANADGVLCRELVSNTYMISCVSEDRGVELLGSLGRQELYCVHQRYLYDFLLQEYPDLDSFACYQSVYEKHERPPKSSPRLEIRTLGSEAIDIVFKNYTAFADYEYIKARLANKALFGGYLEDQICGFIGTHEEGSIGMLEVLDGYKRQGFGSELLMFMTSRFLDSGQTPFGQIALDNEASKALNRKLGYTISEDLLYWVFSV